MFACGQVETTGDKGLGLGIELAHLDRILATVGQGNQTEPLFGGQAVGTLIDPVGALGLGQSVNIENRVPNRIGAAVAFKTGPSPQAAHRRLILPEIVDQSGAERRHRHPVSGIDDGQGLFVETGKARIGLQQI